MSFSNSEILCVYSFTSSWETLLIIAGGVVFSKLRDPSIPQFFNSNQANSNPHILGWV